jgi:broad specificity phosphatase PhoE
MKIYILRHEDRTMDGTFFSPLTADGLENAVKLIEVLDRCKIDYIYSSPFIRTLQTVYPYVKKRNLKINVDHSLSEIQHPHLIPVKSFQINLPTYIAEQFCCNPAYISTLDPIRHNYPEDDRSVCSRVKAFLAKLIREKINTNHNILIVTHQIVCNCILKKATRRYQDVVIELHSNYPKGGVTKVFDTDEFIFEPINWKYVPEKPLPVD